MEIETLKSLLDVHHRDNLFDKILSKLEKFSEFKNIKYEEFKLDGEKSIPCLKLSTENDLKEIKYTKVFTAAQHNEYNGLFAILEFLEDLTENHINSQKIFRRDQDIIFFPLLNPYGFIYPRKDNKSGYYLENGTNLNRYWRKTFAPESPYSKKDANGYPIPEQSKYVKRVLQKYWDRKDIGIYLLDFHESSLLDRYPRDLLNNLKKNSITYKFDHWLKEGIILNIMKLYNIRFSITPLFTKCSPSADHDHINLTLRQMNIIYKKLKDYFSRNQDKLAFYYCYSTKSKNFCQKLARIIYQKLSDIVWETYYPSFDHSFVQHGCFVLMSDATSRQRVYTMELETDKQFYDIFEEREKSKNDPNYFKNKLTEMNKGIKLAKESIKQMIGMF